MKSTLNVGHIDYELSMSWVKIGPIAGFLGIAAYFAAATDLLPSRVTLILAFAMGPLLSAAFIGFYHFLRVHRNSVALQTATAFGVIAGTLVNLMLLVQQSLFIGLPSGMRAAMGPALGFGIGKTSILMISSFGARFKFRCRISLFFSGWIFPQMTGMSRIALWRKPTRRWRLGYPMPIGPISRKGNISLLFPSPTI